MLFLAERLGACGVFRYGLTPLRKAGPRPPLTTPHARPIPDLPRLFWPSYSSAPMVYFYFALDTRSGNYRFHDFVAIGQSKTILHE